MPIYVIKSWYSSNQPDTDGNYILIEGRQEGLISWLLSVFRIEPTVTIRVTENKVEFAEGSLAGNVRRVIPMLGICSSLYGYEKPWQKAAGMFFVLAWVLGAMGAGIAGSSGGGGGAAFGGLVAVAIAAVVALIYYSLNKTMTLGFVENSGLINAIQFKRSVIENKTIDEQHAAYVCDLTQHLIQAKLRSLRTP